MNLRRKTRTFKIERVALIFSAFLLLISLVAYPIGYRAIGLRKFYGKVAEIIPAASDFPEWVVKERAIAETPEMQRAIAELLNFEQGVYRTFENGSFRISIYLTYWSPGRMSQRSVGGHTPDVCWVASGWSNLLDQARTISREVGSRRSIRMESRVFRIEGMTEYVAFAHFVGGHEIAYGDGKGPRWHAFVTDLFNKGFSQRDEQFFIRISSNRPLEEFLEMEPVQRSLANLGEALGL